MTTKKLRGGVAALAILLATAAAGPVKAESADAFPSKPITIIVNLGAGGPTDLPARQIASYLEKKFKQAVVVENKTGGGGVIGIAAVAKAAPDGYTIGTVTNGALAFAPHLRAVPYNAEKDFTYLAQVADFLIPLCVLPDAPWKTLADFVADARKNPGELTYGTAGAGSSAHLLMDSVGRKEKVRISHVPFPGGAQSIAALLGGHVKATLDAALAKNAATGECRALAVMGKKRNAKLPDVPSFHELGYTVEMPVWSGIAGPAGIPEPIAAKLSAAIVEATRDPAYKALLDRLLLGDATAGGKEFTEQVLADYKRVGSMLDELGVTAKKN